jgi:hypothetical protein
VPLDISAPGAADTHTLNNAGTIRDAGPWWELGWPVVLTGSGAGRVVIHNDGYILGRIDFSALQGGVEFNNTASGDQMGWTFYNDPGEAVVFSAGDNVLNNEGIITGNGFIEFGDGNNLLQNGGNFTGNARFGSGNNTVRNTGTMSGNLDFGDGDNVLDNAGTMFSTLSFGEGNNVINNGGTLYGSGAFVGLDTIINSGSMGLRTASELRTLTNSGTLDVLAYPQNVVSTPQLETFSNSGVIAFAPSGGMYLASGRWFMPGADFIASEGSRIIMHARLEAGFQDVCGPVHVYSQADCINLAGGSTSGVTQVTLTGYLPSDEGDAYAAKGVALIDVSGGVSHDGDFVLDPASQNFDHDAPFGGGIRASELFTYHLFYDDSTQIHRLVGIPSSDFLTLGVLPAAAQSLWRTGDEAAAARQAELRLAKSDAAGGLWFKASNGQSDRDAQTEVALFGRSDTFQANYEQRDRARTLGADIVGGEGGNGYSLGIGVGDIHSTIRFDASSTRAELSGIAVNIYGSYRKGGFFLDLSGGGYSGDLEGNLVVGSQQADLKTRVNAFGARTEAGYQLTLSQGLSVEPLASVVYVRSGLSDIQHLPGSSKNALQFDPGGSLRGGLGARAIYDSALAGVKLGLSLTGRVWREFEGETTSYVRTRVDAMPFSSEFNGTFSEASAALDISSAGGAVSGYLSFGGRFGDDYDNTTASLGIRYNW